MNFYGYGGMQRMLNARNPQMGAPNQMSARLPVYSQIAAQMSQPQTSTPMQAPQAQSAQSGMMTTGRAPPPRMSY